CDFCFIPSPLKIAHLRETLKNRKKGHRYSGGGISSHHGSDLDLNSQAAHEEYSRPAQMDSYDYDMDPKDTGPLNLGKKSQRLGKKEQPYVVVPNMRPVVFVGPSLKGYEVTDMMQKALFDYLKKKFEGRCNIVRISSDLSQARRNMPRTEENRAICEDYDRIYELGKNLQLVILDCDMINNPSQLEKTGLMPINVFIKINDPEVLKRLIRWRGRQQMRHMSVQWMAAEKLCQCDPNVFDVCLDENVFEEACEHLTEYLEAYWNATHPVLPEATHPKAFLNKLDMKVSVLLSGAAEWRRNYFKSSKCTHKAHSAQSSGESGPEKILNIFCYFG
ncbi:unnamed protein product, partial [Oikopleura dioica]